jgi:hypothetical protein
VLALRADAHVSRGDDRERLGVDFDVHEPPELAEHLREFAGRLMRAAGPSA